RPSLAADRRAVVEARILSALEELLSDGASFTELGVERIARAAGISRSTFYLYFADKTDLLIRLSASLKLGAFDIRQDWRPHDPPGGLEVLARLYEGIIKYLRDHAGLLAAVSEVAGYDPAVRASWTGGEEQFASRMASLLVA